jgi:hypothetical protein
LPFTITTQAVKEKERHPVVQKRQVELLDKLKLVWRLAWTAMTGASVRTGHALQVSK